MKFSKRPRPMDFGAPDEDPRDAPAAAEKGPLGFRLDPQVAGRPVAVHGARPPAKLADDEQAVVSALDEDRPPAGWPIWLVAFAVAVLWALAPIAFAVGYRRNVSPLQDDVFALAVFALLAIGPAVFVFGAAYLIRQGQKLAHETRRSHAMAQDMLTPSFVAAARAGDIAQSIRDEIARAGRAAEEARETLVALREALAFETDKLTGATAQSVRTANELADTLGRERSEMSGLAQTLDAQATKVADAIAQQARMVTDATSVAEAQIREAEQALSARAADLAAAASEASDAARTAGEDLTRHIARLETAGVGVSDQVRAVEAGLTEQRAALVALSNVLRSDHEAFAAGADAHASSLAKFIDEARNSAAEMNERATSGGEALRRMMSDATVQFRNLAEAANTEREAFGRSTRQALDAVSGAASEQRAHLEAQARGAVEALSSAAEGAREAAARHALAAREQVDQLSEAAFVAGQKANQAFEARLEEARALIEQSSKMVEDAGQITAKKLADGAASARTTLDELAAMLAALEERAANLPASARGHAEQVRAAVADGMDELMAQARRTAQEAQAIDAAFQERVRRNFEMLSEAVRLMGAAAVAPPVAAVPPPATPAKAEPAPPPKPSSEPASEPPGAALADSLGLRNRIRLTPTATDREFSAVFEAAGGPTPAQAPASEGDEDEAAGDTWTWKDLLASLDGADGEGARLEAALGAELAKMGVDAEKLLPRPRIDEIAAAVQTGDVDGAREVVRKLAPAATRRIARRLFTDDEVRRRSEVYVRRYKTLVDDAIARDPEGFVLQNLLGAESGRIFLLLDAAGGDML